MNKSRVWSVVLLASLIAAMAAAAPDREETDSIPLSAPETSSRNSVAWALQNRQAVRDFLPGSIRLQQLVQLVWAAQGVTDRSSERRTAPSFNDVYPLNVYILAGNVEQLGRGLYKYLPIEHALTRISSDDLRSQFAQSIREQWIANAPVVLIFTGDYDRAARQLGKNSARYVDIELGHAVQNIYLQAAALHLGTTFFATFDNKKVNELLNLPSPEFPVGIMPVGRIP